MSATIGTSRPGPDTYVGEMPVTAEMAAMLGPNAYGLAVLGTCLENQRIYHGDIVYVNPDRQPRDGDVVAALGHYAGGQQQLIVKVWKQDADGTPYLAMDGPPPHNQNCSECVRFEVLGVVLASYHSLV